MIKIAAKQTINGEDDGMEFITEGEYEFSPERSLLTYMESAITGMDGTKTTFSIEPDTVTLTREGSVTSQMLFRRGAKHVFLYTTPYGATTLGVTTKRLDISVNGDSGHMDIDYALDADNVKLGDNSFSIDFSYPLHERN
jgi:uncharacterized beta-barrel protein YwiB (DUF1934 family)